MSWFQNMHLFENMHEGKICLKLLQKRDTYQIIRIPLRLLLRPKNHNGYGGPNKN